MIRFGDLLKSNLTDYPRVFEEVFPKSVLQRFPIPKRLKKLSGYVDKYVIFPKYLKSRLNNSQVPFDLVHIIDHSNATYLPIISKVSSAKKLITCHDLIAIRTSLKEFSEAPPTSRSGIILQNWILECLKYSDNFVCDSSQTLQDLNRLVNYSKSRSEVIYLGTAKPTNNRNNFQGAETLPFDISNTSFFLHVGSASWYKNRSSVLSAFKKTKETFANQKLHLVLVGPTPQNNETDLSMRKWIKKHGKFIHSLNNIDDKSLYLLYKNAKVLLFPSYIEGFGWPPLEASTQGCPVITTKTGAIHEILKNKATFINPMDQISFNQSIAKILISPPKKDPVKNIPTVQNCAISYLKLYKKIIDS